MVPTSGREKQHPFKVIDQIFEPDLGSSPDQPHRSNKLPAHRRHLVVEDMLNGKARPRSTSVSCSLLRRQGLVPIAFFLNVRTERLPLE